MQKIMAFVVVITGLFCATHVALADYPTRPITLVLGFPAGGPSDVMARIFGKKLEQVLGQPIVIETRTGAGGNLAGEMVARAAPDGYTLLLANSGMLAANVRLYKRMGFDPEKDFAPITLVGAQANVLVINPSVPARTLAELIAFAQTNPGKISFASGGHGSSQHLAGELLKREAKIDILHVPYRGIAPALQDVIAGHVPMMFSSVSPVLGHIQSGSLRPLAVTTLQRTALLPKIPTIAESGFPGFEATGWHGLVAPAGTSREVIMTIYRAMMITLNDREVRTSLTDLGVDIAATTPDEFAAYIKAEIPKWAAIIKVSGATLE
jgi:tripartite-type tricarboxylate transporter receptor subunit TctC